jgi:hypothetical protein
MNRRKFIVSGVTASITLAGCTNTDDDETNTTSNTTTPVHTKETQTPYENSINMIVNYLKPDSNEVTILVDSNEILSRTIQSESSFDVNTEISSPGEYTFEIYLNGDEVLTQNININDYSLEHELQLILELKEEETRIKKEE